jgi:hypothetical protein
MCNKRGTFAAQKWHSPQHVEWNICNAIQKMTCMWQHGVLEILEVNMSYLYIDVNVHSVSGLLSDRGCNECDEERSE